MSVGQSKEEGIIMKASDLKGRAVVTLSDAAKVGHVDDVLFDATYRRVLGFRVKRGAFDHADALPRDSVTSVGTDALTVDSPDAINAEGRFADLVGATSLGQVHGTKVVTNGGTLVGTIAEVEIDDAVRRVDAYTLSVPLLDKLRHRAPALQAEDVLRLGEDGIMIVPDAVGQALHAS